MNGIENLKLHDVAWINNIFSKKAELIHVPNQHIGLMSSENLSTVPGLEMKLQGIDPSIGQDGRIWRHNHEGIIEIIILQGDSYYADLPPAVETVGAYKIHVVPAGFFHGNNDKPSYGYWLSVKVTQELYTILMGELS